jgi:hypothetical protein
MCVNRRQIDPNVKKDKWSKEVIYTYIHVVVCVCVCVHMYIYILCDCDATCALTVVNGRGMMIF